MDTISRFMTRDHRVCDDLFTAAENAAGKSDWTACAQNFGKFHDAMEHHFAMEEQVLFPAFEAQTGMTLGPTQVMRSEHVQMREALKRMADAVARQNADAYLGESETLLILMQQHNIKEESVLYPMSEQALGIRQAELIATMTDLHKAA